MNILSIQSHVAYGHVGNASAVFAMQRLGAEVWPIHTVQFSNHTGYGAWRGQVFDAGLIADCVTGIEERGALARCDGVLSGYMGSSDTGTAILDAVTRVRSHNPSALYACDPVIGDTGRGIFVRPGIPEFMRERAVPGADIITPNLFELAYLSGRDVRDADELRNALGRVHALGPRLILVTSLILDDTPEDGFDLAVSDGSAIHRLRTPRLACAVNGAGDAIAALFFVHQLAGRSPAESMALAGSSVHGILRRTVEAQSREILLIAAQEELVNPGRLFAPAPL